MHEIFLTGSGESYIFARTGFNYSFKTLHYEN